MLCSNLKKQKRNKWQAFHCLPSFGIPCDVWTDALSFADKPEMLGEKYISHLAALQDSYPFIKARVKQNLYYKLHNARAYLEWMSGVFQDPESLHLHLHRCMIHACEKSFPYLCLKGGREVVRLHVPMELWQQKCCFSLHMGTLTHTWCIRMGKVLQPDRQFFGFWEFISSDWPVRSSRT